MSYTQSFFIETVFNKKKYFYSIAPNSEGIPNIETISVVDVDEANRSKLWFYLKDEYDARKFVKGALHKTMYFDNLVYDFDPHLDDLNVYKRVESDTFVFSQAKPFSDLHVIIGQVPYPLDYDILGIPRINVPIGIKISGVMPAPTRENIKYTPKSIDIISKNIAIVADEVIDRMNNDRKNITDYSEFLTLKAKPNMLKINIGDDKIVLNVSNLMQYASKKVQSVDFVPLRNIDTTNLYSSNLLPILIKKRLCSYSKETRPYNSYTKYVQFIERFGNHYNIYRTDQRLSGLKNKYLIDKHNSDIYIAYKQDLKLKDYVTLLQLNKVTKSEWRKQIIKYQKFVDSVFNALPNYDKVVVEQEYIDKLAEKRKKLKQLEKEQEKEKEIDNSNIDYSSLLLTNRVVYKYDIYNSSSIKYSSTPRSIPMSSLPKNCMIIYGNRDDRSELDKAASVLSVFISKNKLIVIDLVDSNVEFLNPTQAVHVSKWKNTRYFKKAITTMKIMRLFDANRYFTYNCLSNKSSHYTSSYVSFTDSVKKLNDEYNNLLTELITYVEKYKKYGTYYQNTYDADLVDYAEKHGLFDYTVYYKIDKLAKYFEKFQFLHIFDKSKNWLPYAVNYIKYISKDIKLPLQYYQKSNNEI